MFIVDAIFISFASNILLLPESVNLSLTTSHRTGRTCKVKVKVASQLWHCHFGDWFRSRASDRNYSHYLSHCYTIAWDRLSNQFFLSVYVCMCVCVYVCMYVCVCRHAYGRIFQPIFTKFGKNLWGSESEELIRLGTKSENAFLYFSPKNQNFGGVNRHFKPNLQKFQIVISSKLYIGLA